MTTVRCENCETEYPRGVSHGAADCIAALVRARDELRVYLTTEGPEHLRTENACLRSALFRSENERKMALGALTRTQGRCTELLEEVRLLKGGGVKAADMERVAEGLLQGWRENP